MKYLVNFFVILFFLIYSNIVNANEKILYINMNQILNNSLAGEFINKESEKIHIANISYFKEKESKLKKEESEILLQKNILSETEYSKKIVSLKQKIKDYQSEQKNKIKSLNEKRSKAKSKLLSNLNFILTEYSEKNNISLILNKENIIIAKKDLDITADIIILLNKKIKKINLN
tara:strand:+ start:760 stop:1284 length:525 start_codon:yes stop_codon:yes gene_type:complete